VTGELFIQTLFDTTVFIPDKAKVIILTTICFIHDVGVPLTGINNNAKEEVKGRINKTTCDTYRIKIKLLSRIASNKKVQQTLPWTDLLLKLWYYLLSSLQQSQY
jgi:hypothetical protein